MNLKRMMKINIFIVVFLLLISCNSNNSSEIKSHFVDIRDDEFWGLYTKTDCFKFTGHYIKFYKNDIYKDFQWDTNGNLSEVNIHDDKKWNVTNDSILSYNYRFKYKIVLINEGTILVSSGNGVSFMFIKESSKNLRKAEWELNKDSLKLNNP